MTEAFLYKWTELSTGKWYVGSRTAQGCNVHDGYICSSKYVKPMIIENIDNWTRTILVVGTPTYIRSLETLYLQLINAKADAMSYNRSNADADFLNTSREHNPMFGKKHSDISRARMSIAGKGKKRSATACRNISESHVRLRYGPCSDTRKEKISAANKGRPSEKKGKPGKSPSEETRLKLSVANKKYKPTEETKAKIRATIASKKQGILVVDSH